MLAPLRVEASAPCARCCRRCRRAHRDGPRPRADARRRARRSGARGRWRSSASAVGSRRPARRATSSSPVGGSRRRQVDVPCPSAPLLAALLRRRRTARARRPARHDQRNEARAPTRATRGNSQDSGAIAVDMETAAVAAAAAAAGGPLAAVAVVVRRHRRRSAAGIPASSSAASSPCHAARDRAAARAVGGGRRRPRGRARRRRARSAPGSSVRSTPSPLHSNASGRRSTCAARSSTTLTSCAELEQRGARCSSRSWTRCPTGARSCSPRTASRPRCVPKRSTAALAVIDATCPLVAKVHSEARRHARAGDAPSCWSATTTTRKSAGRSARRRAGSGGRHGRGGRRGGGRATRARVAYADADDAGRRRGRAGRRRAAGAIPRARRRRRPRTSATPRPNRQKAVREVAADADLVSSSARRTRRTRARLVEVAERRGRRAHCSSTRRAGSTWVGCAACARIGHHRRRLGAAESGR